MRVVVIIVVLLAGFFTMPWWMPRKWYRALLYPGHRPNALSKMLNSAGGWATARGIGASLMVTIETRGRRTGKIVRVPLVPSYVGPDRYLVSFLGEKADWVLNARAAGGEATLRHGEIEKVKLEGVPVSERAPILKDYLRRAPGGRPHFDIEPDAPLTEFAKVASRYPVFRIIRL